MIKLIKNYKNYIKKLHNSGQAVDHSDILKTLSKMRIDILKDQDTAVIKYTKKFDRVTDPKFSLIVTPKEIKDAYAQVSKDFIAAIKKAKKNIEWYHKQQLPKSWYKKQKDGRAFGMEFNPIEVAGLYVPGGRAPYPSTVLMNSIPAKIAGVGHLIVATPPGENGCVDPSVLVAADICGVDTIVKAGGAQAVFALAQGTKTIPKVDKIVGPGNIFVTMAKQMVYGQVDIDKPAGPSESLVYIDNEKYVSFAAAELLAQLEHDPLASAVGVSESEIILTMVQAEIKKQIINCKRKDVIKGSIKNSALILTKDLKESIDAMNLVASEHLVLITDKHDSIRKKIKHAGAIFLGPYTPVALGDYYAGTNHVLPTAGAARFASPLGVMDFIKYSSLLYFSKQNLQSTSEDMHILTSAEQFDAHGNSVTIRL
jgi:histidinol dehydrogenase